MDDWKCPPHLAVDRQSTERRARVAAFAAFVKDANLFDATEGTYVAFISQGNVLAPSTGKFLGFVADGCVLDTSGSPVAFFSGSDLFEHDGGAWARLLST